MSPRLLSKFEERNFCHAACTVWATLLLGHHHVLIVFLTRGLQQVSRITLSVLLLQVVLSLVKFFESQLLQVLGPRCAPPGPLPSSKQLIKRVEMIHSSASCFTFFGRGMSSSSKMPALVANTTQEGKVNRRNDNVIQCIIMLYNVIECFFCPF